MAIMVGAYAASPAHTQWNPTLEQEYLEALSALRSVRGLELPWIDGIHPHDSDWLLAHWPESMDVMLTDIGGTVTRLSRDARFGLASTGEDGRLEAVAQARRVRDDVSRLNDHTGRGAVIAIELHSAPLASAGSSDALARSLEEISTWDWGGGALLIEHCDALVDGQQPEKGYLSLDHEVAAIEKSGTDVGLSLNWGRSAIELRSAARVLDHVTRARESGRLRSVVFSGAAATAGAFGNPWVDAHLPLAASPDFPAGDPHSLLTLGEVRATLAMAGPLDLVGIKFGWKKAGAPVADRVAMIESGAELVMDALSSHRLAGR